MIDAPPQPAEFLPEKCLLAGIGSPHGDDQIGWKLTERIGRVGPSLRCRFARSPADVLGWMDDLQWLGIIDACYDNQPVGTLQSWKWPAAELERQQFFGTHDLHLVEVLNLADQMQLRPLFVQIWGITIEHSQPFAPLSELLENELDQLADRIRDEIAEYHDINPA